jgi:hypothetical protein
LDAGTELAAPGREPAPQVASRLDDDEKDAICIVDSIGRDTALAVVNRKRDGPSACCATAMLDLGSAGKFSPKRAENTGIPAGLLRRLRRS